MTKQALIVELKIATVNFAFFVPPKTRSHTNDVTHQNDEQAVESWESNCKNIHHALQESF